LEVAGVRIRRPPSIPANARSRRDQLPVDGAVVAAMLSVGGGVTWGTPVSARTLPTGVDVGSWLSTVSLSTGWDSTGWLATGRDWTGVDSTGRDSTGIDSTGRD
jgi:hypothetical protein